VGGALVGVVDGAGRDLDLHDRERDHAAEHDGGDSWAQCGQPVQAHRRLCRLPMPAD
jgi:hypothetical protein